MTTGNATMSIQDALNDEALEKLAIDYELSLRELFTIFSGDERAEEVVRNVKRYAAHELGLPFDPDLSTVDSQSLEKIREVTSSILQRWVPAFITDEHREFIVRCHAHGLSTAGAVTELIWEDSTMERLSQPDAVGFKELKSVLVPRFAYLKPGTTRWPEKKYGELWHKEREQHKRALRDIPLTSATEQTVLLAKHAGRLNNLLENDEHSPADWQLLTNSLVKTLDSLRKVSATEQQEPTNLSGPQLVAVLERLTLALDTPEQPAFSTDTDALVGVLERLTLALKSPKHKAIAENVEIIPANTITDNGDPA